MFGNRTKLCLLASMLIFALRTVWVVFNYQHNNLDDVPLQSGRIASGSGAAPKQFLESASQANLDNSPKMESAVSKSKSDIDRSKRDEYRAHIKLARVEVGMEDASRLLEGREHGILEMQPASIRIISLTYASSKLGQLESLLQTLHTFRLGTPLVFGLTCEIHVLLATSSDVILPSYFMSLAKRAPGCAILSVGSAPWYESLALVPSTSDYVTIMTDGVMLKGMDTGDALNTMRRHKVDIFASPYEQEPQWSDEQPTYNLFHGVSETFCGDDEVYNGGSSGLAACQRLCDKEPACKYVSSWTTSWCRLTNSCDKLVSMQGHGIIVYKKQTHPDWYSVSEDGKLCAEEGQTCLCDGLVFFGKKYRRGKPGSGHTVSLREMMDTHFVWQQSSGGITCHKQGMGHDPAFNAHKYCYCVPQKYQSWSCHHYKVAQDDEWCRHAGTQGIYEYRLQDLCGACNCCKRRAIPRQQHRKEDVKKAHAMTQQQCLLHPAAGNATLNFAIFTKSGFECWRSQVFDPSHSCQAALAINDQQPIVAVSDLTIPLTSHAAPTQSISQLACAPPPILGLADDLYLQQSSHRGGWKVVMQHVIQAGVLSLRPRDGQLLFVDCMESVFLWQQKTLDQPWIGILHYTANLPSTYPEHVTLQGLLKSRAFLASKTWCKLVIVLSRTSQQYIQEYHPGIKVVSMKHPIGMTDVTRHYDLPAFKANRQSWKVILLGQQYRRVSTLVFLRTKYPKVWMPGMKLDKAQFLERYRMEPNLPPNPDTSGFEIFRTEKFQEYDHLLMTNIIILDLLDAAANNALLEMINLAIPMLVSRHPAVEEYLGPAYPLYFTSIHEIERILDQEDKFIERMELAHKYLVKLPKDDLQMSWFAASLEKAAREIKKEMGKWGSF